MRAVPVLVLAFFTSLLLSVPAYARDPFSVSGIVTDADGTPLPRAGVVILDATNLSIVATFTGADGTFAFDNLTRVTSKFIVKVSYATPMGYGTHELASRWHEAVGHVVVPASETRFGENILSGKGYIYGFIFRESDHMVINATVYLSNGDTFEVTNPHLQYLFEVSPGNYTIYAVHREDGQVLVSDKVKAQALPVEKMDGFHPLNLWLKPISLRNPGALAFALALGLACILALRFVLRRPI